MDDIAVPSPRREELLRLLGPHPVDPLLPPSSPSCTQAVSLSPSDEAWLGNNMKWTEAEIKRMKPFFATRTQV
jgi:hypothetical protein